MIRVRVRFVLRACCFRALDWMGCSAVRGEIGYRFVECEGGSLGFGVEDVDVEWIYWLWRRGGRGRCFGFGCVEGKGREGVDCCGYGSDGGGGGEQGGCMFTV